jgi:nitrate/nitrite-specific signal transduction histidine kinase
LQVVKKLPPCWWPTPWLFLTRIGQYQERALARDGLKRMYLGTLTLSLFLAVFGAVLLAVLLGNQLARPLLLLAEGVRDVAAGDLSPRAVLQGKDELDGLTRVCLPLAVHLGKALTDIEGLQVFGRQVMEQFHEFASEQQQRSLDHWQQSFEIDTKTQQTFVEFGPERQLHTTLVARGAVLPQGEWLLCLMTSQKSCLLNAPRRGLRWREGWPMRLRTL